MDRYYSLLKVVFSILIALNILGVGEAINENYFIYIIIFCVMIIMDLCRYIVNVDYRYFRIGQFVIIGLSYVFGMTYMIFMLLLLVCENLRGTARGVTYFVMAVQHLLSIDGEMFIYYINYSVILYVLIIGLEMLIDRIINLKEELKNKNMDKFNIENRMMTLERYVDHQNVITKLEERNKMSQRVHDHLGHRITSSIMLLRVTKEVVDIDRKLSSESLDKAIDNLSVGMEEIRNIVREIKPDTNIIGIERIKDILYRVDYDTRIKTNLDISGDIRKLTYKHWIVIEDNLREAITNMCKHSSATIFKVSIFVYDKVCRVTFMDNGVGSQSVKKSIGIHGMEERMNTLGGSITINGSDGFTIDMIIKLGDIGVERLDNRLGG